MNGGINTYGYVGGNPVNYYDPRGLSACSNVATVAGSVIGGGIGYYGGGLLGLIGGGAAGSVVPVAGTITGAGAGAVAGSTAGGAGGAVLGGIVGNAIGNLICSDTGEGDENNVIPLFPEANTSEADEECDDDNGCGKNQKSLIATGAVIMELYGYSTDTQDVLAAQVAIMRYNQKVSAHNASCPNHKVVPLPPILI